MLIDGRAASTAFDREASEIRHLPPERLANGRHDIEIRLRNVNGNAARPWKSEFKIAMPPAHVFINSNFNPVRAGSPAPVPVLVFFTTEAFAVPALTGATFTTPELDTETFTVPKLDTETWND